MNYKKTTWLEISFYPTSKSEITIYPARIIFILSLIVLFLYN